MVNEPVNARSRTGGVRRRRSALVFLADQWWRIAAVLAALGVVLGVFGYRQLAPDSSWTDSVYSGLQLLLVAGPGVGDHQSIPVLLDVGRYLAAIAAGATVLLLLIRRGAEGADVARARRATRHRVVFGNTAEAAALLRALMAAPGRRQRGCQGVLVGSVDDGLSAALRREGIVHLCASDEKRLAGVLRGAEEVVIAETDDAVAINTLLRVRSVLSDRHRSHPDGSGIPVRLLLSSTDLARAQRPAPHEGGDQPIALTVISKTEAAAFALTEPEWFPALSGGRRDHVTVIGAGHLARELVVTTVSRRALRGEPLEVDILCHPASGGCDDLAERLSTDTISVTVRHLPMQAEAVADTVRLRCLDNRQQHQVFVVDLADDLLCSISHRLAATVPGLTIVRVLENGLLDAAFDGQARAVGTTLRSVTVANLLTQEGLLRASVRERLGELLADELLLVHRVPGLDDAVVTAYLEDVRGRARWAAALGTSVLDTLQHSGWLLEQHSAASPPVAVLDSRTLLALCDVLNERVSSLRSDTPEATWALRLMLVAQVVPTLLSRLAYHLRAEVPGRHHFDHAVVEQVAPAIHAVYLATKAGHANATDTPAARSAWAALSEADREANREQARNIPAKLALLRLEVVSLESPGSRELTLDDPQIAFLARFEHDRWVAQKLNTGWTYGPERNDGLKHHPSIIPFDELSVAQQDLDREPARNVPNLLAHANLGVRDLHPT